MIYSVKGLSKVKKDTYRLLLFSRDSITSVNNVFIASSVDFDFWKSY